MKFELARDEWRVVTRFILADFLEISPSRKKTKASHLGFLGTTPDTDCNMQPYSINGGYFIHELFFSPLGIRSMDFYGLSMLFSLYVVGLVLIRQGLTPTENITLAVDQDMLISVMLSGW